MKLTDYREFFRQSLVPVYGEAETDSFFYIIADHLHQLRRIDLAMNPGFSLSEPDVASWDRILEKLRNEEPLQYILGTAHFYGMEFQVNPSVLIPRQETEELVRWIIDDFRDFPEPRVLDIGTGSGCIAISLARYLRESHVSAIDVSEEALATARKNASRNAVGVTFMQADVLQVQSLPGKFDIIVSNPPYVRHQEKREIKKNVLDHEPHLALFVADDDPLVFYRKIASLAKESLSAGGRLYFEINQYLGKDMVSLLQPMFTTVTLMKDIYGNDRMICAYS